MSGNNHTELTEKLKQLRGLADDAIGDIESDRGEIAEEPINWADLSCVEACHVINDDGEERFEVLIEEASPSCQRLAKSIREYLERHGWPDVDVLVEW